MNRNSRSLAAALGVGLTLLVTTPAQADATRNSQWHLGFLHIAQAQRYSQGAGVTVAVVDSGVDASHPDLAGSVLAGTDLTSSGRDGRSDMDGHGTGMAGLIAAHGHGGSGGVLGIAPKAKILPVRQALGGDETDTPVPGGILWATQHGAKVISLSWVSEDTPDLREEIRQALAADVVVVAGIGNRPRDTTVGYPAALDGVLAVGAIDQHGHHAAVSVTGDKVAISAPGVDITSTGPYQTYRTRTGTSDATAIVAGVAALVRAKYPKLSAQEVIHRLTATADDKGVPGRDPEYGYGMVDPVAALTAEVPALAASPSPSAATAAPSSASTEAVPADKSNGTGRIVAIGLGLLLVGAAVGGGVFFWRRTHGRPS